MANTCCVLPKNDLPELETEYKIQELANIDWDFVDAQTQYSTHKFHSYPARFIPQIPLTFIEQFTKPRDTVLDPFCGCGTTLVEAVINGRHAIGNDFNPLACLLTKVKTTPLTENEIQQLQTFVNELPGLLASKNRPAINELVKLPNRKISKLFTPEMCQELSCIKLALDQLPPRLRDFSYIALSSTIRAIIEAENGNNVYRTFQRKIQQMSGIMADFHLPTGIRTQVIKGDARFLTRVNDNSVDLIVTSPPYVNALDYYREHMYNMLWLGMDYQIFKKHEIGGHSHFVQNRFRLLAQYLGDMLRAMLEMARVLKEGHLSVIVIGNSTLEFELIESHKFFTEMSATANFTLKKTIPRNIDVTRKYTSRNIGNIDDEHIIILQKSAGCHPSSSNDELVTKIVTEQMLKFRDKVKKNPGSAQRRRKVSPERLQDNLRRLDEAIATVGKDVQAKD